MFLLASLEAYIRSYWQLTGVTYKNVFIQTKIILIFTYHSYLVAITTEENRALRLGIAKN